MDYYNEIKNELIKVEIYDRVKDYLKDKNKINVYYKIGKLLSEAGKDYGKNIIGEYSKKLMLEVGKKYNERTLRRIRQFYETFSSEKWSTSWTKLTWSHYREVLVLKDINAIRYYLNQCEIKNLTIKQLQGIIKNHEYDRLNENTKNKLIKSEQLGVADLIPNPIVIKTDIIDKKLSEYALKQIIIGNLDDFLFQLGHGFTYVGSEYKIKIGNTYNYIDLLLFNYEYNCFVVVELKVTELKKEHIGQIQVYMNYIDDNLRNINQNKTIGIIICREDNEYIIKYCSDERIIARKYELI